MKWGGNYPHHVIPNTQKNWVSIIAYFSANYRESRSTVRCQRCTLCATAVLLLLKMFTTQFFFWFFTWCLLLQLFLLYFVQPNNYLTSYDPNHLKHKMKWLSFDLETFLMDCMSFCLHFFSIVRKTICWDLDFFTFNMKKQCFFLSQTLYFAIQFYFWKEHNFMLVYFGIVFFYKCLANSKVSRIVCHKRSCC